MFRYKHILDGLIRISQEEGISTLASGCHVAILRGVVVTISQNLAYDKVIIKIVISRLLSELLLNFKLKRTGCQLLNNF